MSAPRRSPRQVELTAAQPEAVVEFEGTLVVAIQADEIVARFGREQLRDSDALDRANVGLFREEVWLDGSWQGWAPGHRIEIPLSLGSNEVRYRWMFALTDGADSGTVPIEAWLTPVFIFADLTPPTEA